MPHYRLYFFDGPAGHICKLGEIEVETDDDAMVEASKLVDGQMAELWCERRKVRRFEAPDGAADRS